MLEQGKTYPGWSTQTHVSGRILTRTHPSADAQGDLLRGLQVVETATGIPTSLLGSNIEGIIILRVELLHLLRHLSVTKDMDTSTRRLPLGVCARYGFM